MDRPLQALSLAFAAAVILTVVSGPMVQGTFIGEGWMDAWGTQWFYWWVGGHLAAPGALAHTDLFFHPWGKDVYLHTGGNVLDAVLAAPFRAILGPVRGYDLFIAAILASNGWSVASLARTAGAGPGPAAAAGALVVADPFVLGEIHRGRPTQAILVFAALFFRELIRARLHGARLAALRAGIFFALTNLTYWFLGLFCALPAAILLAAGFLRPEAGDERGALARRAGVVVLAGAVVGLPFAAPMLAGGARIPGLLDYSAFDPDAWIPRTAEGVVVGLSVLSPLQRAVGFLVPDPAGGPNLFQAERVVLPWSGLLLAGAGVLVAPRGVRGPGAVMLAVGLAVACGPVLLLGEHRWSNPAFLAIVHASPFASRLWWPSRALALVTLGGGVLAAGTLHRLPTRWRVAAVAAAALGVAAELASSRLLPTASWDPEVPGAWQCLAQAGEGAVIELPYADATARVWYQVLHRRPILGGMVEDNPLFTPPEQLALRSENTWLASLIAVSELRDGPSATEADRKAVHDLGYRWVALDTRRWGDGKTGRVLRMRRLVQELAGRPVYQDQGSTLYAPWGDESPCGR